MFAALTPVTKWLLIANIVMFVLDVLVSDGLLGLLLAFSIEQGLMSGWIWQFVSCQFIHAEVMHLLMNSLGLYFLGPTVERWWGSKFFLRFYLVCGAAGAVFYTLLFWLHILPRATVDTLLMGASAGIFGILFAIYVIAPDQKMRLLFPPITVSMRQIAVFILLISVGTILGGLLFPGSSFFENEGGEAGHLGGAIMGVLLMKHPWLVGKGRRTEQNVIRPKQFRTRRCKPKIRARSQIDLASESEIDRILDKINEQGVGSLSKQEKELLEAMNKKR